MAQPSLFYDYSKRDYLLPAGCKNLIDVLNQPKLSKSWSQWIADMSTMPDPIREILIPYQITVRALSRLLGLKPFQIVACLIADFKMFKNMNETLDFDTAARVALQFGFKAKKMLF